MESKTYICKGRKYTKKSGEVVQYNQKVNYIPRRKKFDDLLEDIDISEILERNDVRKIDKVDDICKIVNLRYNDKKFTREQISSFVYRNSV